MMKFRSTNLALSAFCQGEIFCVKNTVVFFTVIIILIAAIIIGMQKQKSHNGAVVNQGTEERGTTIPSVGSIQVLNGCGVDGAANMAADFLRTKGFDVKNMGNAATSNYQATIVVSRKKDTSALVIARQVAAALSTEKMILMRNGDETYDATVFIGADFQERIGRR
jgi:hypothetical protein